MATNPYKMWGAGLEERIVEMALVFDRQAR
jgi:hypothetical protein